MFSRVRVVFSFFCVNVCVSVVYVLLLSPCLSFNFFDARANGCTPSKENSLVFLLSI